MAEMEEDTADTKRIVQEMEQLKSSKLITIKKAERIDQSNLQWKIVFDGPEETPYEDGIFTLKLIFPKNYPKKGPEAKFLTKMFHPNIRESDQHVCISLLNYWNEKTTVEFIIFGIFEIIMDPKWEGAYDNEATKLLKDNEEAYYDKVEEYVYNYAQKEC
jgi:ubiquitin-protein ligase